ncbi:serine/threonine protein kinase [Streptomyces sp. NPDC055103]
MGPYRLITRLDPPAAASGSAVPCRRFVARTPDGDRTVLLSAPLPGADPARFAAEADAARHLIGPWIAPVTDVAPPTEPSGSGSASSPAWYASPYVPALPLPVALAVHGGPLPEATVRAVGAALAEGLAAAHTQGLTHAGVSPAAVLLTADGPRLTCFGAVRAAAADGEPRTGLPGLDPGSLAPEQATGGRPRPPGDVFALGAVLAYAATGHTVPEREELPPALRPVISSCLARDPADRPTAAALMTALAPPTAHHTVLNSAGTLLTPGWLPGRVVAALARQSAELLAAELPAAAEQTGPAEHATPARA